MLPLFILDRSSGVYKICCLANNRIYIGSAKNLSTRYQGHVNKLHSNKHHCRHLQFAWNKYGEDQFTFDLLEYCPPTQLIEREQYYLDTLQPFEEGAGFNHLRKAYSSLGHKYSQEIRQKFRDASRRSNGRSFTIIDPTGKVHIGQCITEFAEQHDLNKGVLWAVVSGKTKQIQGWHLPDTDMTVKTYRLIDPWGKIIIIEKGKLVAFCKKQNLLYPNMMSVLRGVNRHHKGWTTPKYLGLFIDLMHLQHGKIKIPRFYTLHFVNKFNLSRGMVGRIINGLAPQHQGWSLDQTVLPTNQEIQKASEAVLCPTH